MTTSYNFTSFGEQVTIGIPIEKSPIVDHNQNGDITDGVTTSDDNNFKILSVTQRKNSESQIVLLCLNLSVSSCSAFHSSRSSASE